MIMDSTINKCFVLTQHINIVQFVNVHIMPVPFDVCWNQLRVLESLEVYQPVYPLQLSSFNNVHKFVTILTIFL